jgi:hypothetical protein
MDRSTSNNLNVILVCFLTNLGGLLVVDVVVTTLTLGSQPRQGVARLLAKRKIWSAKECEGMNPHTPKRTPILGVGVPMDS